MNIPSPLAADYRIATSREIRSWSYGALTAARHPSATFHDNVRGTLHDQRIFGPVHDFRCACGHYSGEKYNGMICDRCGVKIAPKAIRSSRFGHIEFDISIRHPFAPDSELQCFSVLPIHFVESPAGRPLAAWYDRLVEAISGAMAVEIENIVRSIVNHITPAAVTAHNWQMTAAGILARGLALENTTVVDGASEYCAQCGYLLAGLQIAVCPGCGIQR